MNTTKRHEIYEDNGWCGGHDGSRCVYCEQKNTLIEVLDAVAMQATKLFQKDGYFEYLKGTAHQAELQEALKQAGYL